MKLAIISLIITIIIAIIYFTWDLFFSVFISSNPFVKFIIGGVSGMCCGTMLLLMIIITLLLFVARK